jgi:hypothetical protein
MRTHKTSLAVIVSAPGRVETVGRRFGQKAQTGMV